MTRKSFKWLIPAAIVVAYLAVKLSFAPGVNKTAVYDAVTAPLDKLAGKVADNVGLADPSKGTVTALMKAYLSKQDPESWCLNPMKIKSVKDDQPIGLTALGNYLHSHGKDAGSFSADIFPVIFAEEAFIKWNDHDAYVMEMLIGGNYIAVHEGGYDRSTAGRGSPGNIYVPANGDQVDGVIDVIREKGALVDLTDKGRKAGVWDPANGFCLAGYWDLNEVTGWTSPAADNEGKVVTHIKARETFHPTALGAAKTAFNPMGFDYTTVDQEFVAAKFNDGWRIISGD